MGHPSNYASVNFLWHVQKCAAVVINSRRLTNVHIRCKGLKKNTYFSLDQQWALLEELEVGLALN